MKSILLLSLFLAFCACTVFKKTDIRSAQGIQREVENSPVFSKALTGFTLLDPATGKTLADAQGDRYFTPASNTKILTLATCLEVLGDSVPGIKYLQQDSHLIFQGLADPSFLHPKFQYWRGVYNALSDTNTIPLLYRRGLKEPRFGPGWAWDDYSESYQPEKSAFPIYGNTIRILGLKNGQFEVQPPLFRSAVDYPYYDEEFFIAKDIGRREGDNLIGMRRLPLEGEEIVIPFRPPYWEGMLADTIHRRTIEHGYFEDPSEANWRTLYSTPIDTVLRRMMHQSDNFIAEQMLLVCAGVKFDVLKQDTIIKWMLDSTLSKLPQRPKWVDGSGLSRYNLMSPQSIAQVLLKLWNKYPHERLLSFFPAGGTQGTIADWYAGKDGKPYVFAKTGGMSGVACLSGYLRCKSGKVLIFSFMHNHYVGSSRAWKAEMQRLLEQMHERF